MTTALFAESRSSEESAERQADPLALGAGLTRQSMDIVALARSTHDEQSAVAELQGDYLNEATALWNQAVTGDGAKLGDRRFAGNDWATNPGAAVPPPRPVRRNPNETTRADPIAALRRTRSTADLNNVLAS